MLGCSVTEAGAFGDPPAQATVLSSTLRSTGQYKDVGGSEQLAQAQLVLWWPCWDISQDSWCPVVLG